MDLLANVSWEQIFIPTTPLLETFARGTITYLAMFFLLRLMKRQAGEIGVSDFLVVVMIADAAQNAMADDYHSIPDGILLVATIIFWNFVLEWLGFHYPCIEKILTPPPLPLVRNGKMIYRNMRHELVTKDELLSQMRKDGIENISDVKTACMEGDGHISIVAFKDK